MSNLPALLFLLPFTSALLVVALGFIMPKISWWISLLCLGAVTAFSIQGTLWVFSEGALRITLAGWMAPLGIELVLDHLAALAACLVSVVGFLVILGCRSLVKDNLPAFYGCSLLLLSGMMGMVVAGDLFNMFVHVEVASLSAYALVAAGGRRAPRAAFNYLIIGTIGASFYLLGVGFIYAATGTLNMSDAARLFHSGTVDPRLMMVAAVLIVVGFGVKMGLFPLHGWMTAAYARATPMGAVLMAPLVTKVSAYALLRVLFFVFGIDFLTDNAVLLNVLTWAGGAAIVFGGVMAFLQNDLWKLLAYSSVSQMGLVAVGIGLANKLSLTGAVLHIANDAVMKGALFSFTALLLHRYQVRTVADLAMIRGRFPLGGIVFVIAGLSLIGIPPFGGFFGKWYVITGAAAANDWLSIALIVAGSLATAGYFFRMVERLFFGSVDEQQKPNEKVSNYRDGTLLVTCVAMSIAIIALGLFNEKVVSGLVLTALPQLTSNIGG